MTRKTKRRLTLAATVLTIYLILFWIVGLADFFILHPSTERIDTAATQDFISTPSGKLEIYRSLSRACTLSGAPPQAIVLEFIPNAGRAEYAEYSANDWAFLPIQYIALNYPGYGASEGKPTLHNVHTSALAAFDAIRAQNPNTPIFLSAMSLGTPAALHVAAQRPNEVTALILQNPVPLKQLILGRFGWWNLYLAALPVAWDIPKELDAITNAKQVNTPAIFLQAQNDTLVPPTYQDRVFQAYAGPKQKITFPGHHNSPLEGAPKSQYQQALLELWSQSISPVSPTTLPADFKLP